MANMSATNLETSQENIKSGDVKEGLHDMRKSVDALIQWANELRENRESGYGREMSLVHTKLQEATHWVDECLVILEK